MSVVHAASEVVPFSKTGGLADVAAALPKALAEAGERVCVIAPAVSSASAALRAGREAAVVGVPFAGGEARVRVVRVGSGPVEHYLLDHPPSFARAGLYGEGGKDYPDNAERFALYARATLEAAKSLRLESPLFHCHDWQAGLVPALLKSVYSADPVLGRAPSVFTVHNMGYQGVFPKEAMASTGLPWAAFSPDGVEYWGQVSYLKAGLRFADILTTVSPTYAREVMTPEFGRGMEGLLRARSADLHGVLNGLDTAVWDPARDEELPRCYAPKRAASGKAAAKAALQKQMGLAVDPKAFLVGSVTRLDAQKGVDLALAALEARMGSLQYALLGSGAPELEEAARAFASAHPGRAAYRREFDDPLARLIYAASDAFLMPSRYEPCGLGQLIAMRYGSLPVAVATGGLADTVAPHGFLAAAAEAGAVGRALDEAAKAFTDAGGWARRREGAMSAEFGWAAAAARYRELYALARLRVHPPR